MELYGFVVWEVGSVERLNTDVVMDYIPGVGVKRSK